MSVHGRVYSSRLSAGRAARVGLHACTEIVLTKDQRGISGKNGTSKAGQGQGQFNIARYTPAPI